MTTNIKNIVIIILIGLILFIGYKTSIILKYTIKNNKNDIQKHLTEWLNKRRTIS